MSPEFVADRLQLAAAIVLLMIGAVGTLSSTNVAKRVAALVIAQLGALIALSTLHAPAALLLAGAVLSLALVLTGVALLVRLQENYGGVEIADFDAADAESEPAEPGA